MTSVPEEIPEDITPESAEAYVQAYASYRSFGIVALKEERKQWVKDKSQSSHVKKAWIKACDDLTKERGKDTPPRQWPHWPPNT
jgi:hypothetical protein